MDGENIGEILFCSCDEWTEFKSTVKCGNGKKALYFVYSGENSVILKEFKLN